MIKQAVVLSFMDTNEETKLRIRSCSTGNILTFGILSATVCCGRR